MKFSGTLLLFAATAMLILALLAFKSEEPQKEYCKIEFSSVSYRIKIYYADRVDDFKREKGEDIHQTIVRVLNEMSKTGWKLVSSELYIPSNPLYPDEFLYMERIKQ